jgi:hypothetical protein
LSRLVGSRDAGDKVRIEYQRNGQRHEVSTVLGAIDDTETRAALEPIEPGPRTYRYYRYPAPGPLARR